MWYRESNITIKFATFALQYLKFLKAGFVIKTRVHKYEFLPPNDNQLEIFLKGISSINSKQL